MVFEIRTKDDMIVVTHVSKSGSYGITSNTPNAPARQWQTKIGAVDALDRMAANVSACGRLCHVVACEENHRN